MSAALHVVEATHKCRRCGALWRQNEDGTWHLCSFTAGRCCDNEPMGSLIEPIERQGDGAGGSK